MRWLGTVLAYGVIGGLTVLLGLAVAIWMSGCAYAAEQPACPAGRYAHEEYLFLAQHRARPFLAVCTGGQVWCKDGCEHALRKLTKQAKLYRDVTKGEPNACTPRYAAVFWNPTFTRK